MIFCSGLPAVGSQACPLYRPVGPVIYTCRQTALKSLTPMNGFVWLSGGFFGLKPNTPPLLFSKGTVLPLASPPSLISFTDAFRPDFPLRQFRGQQIMPQYSENSEYPENSEFRRLCFSRQAIPRIPNLPRQTETHSPPLVLPDFPSRNSLPRQIPNIPIIRPEFRNAR